MTPRSLQLAVSPGCNAPGPDPRHHANEDAVSVPRIPPLAGRITERDSLRLLPSKPALACASSPRIPPLDADCRKFRIEDSLSGVGNVTSPLGIQRGQSPIRKYEAGIGN